ncbi:MAG: hypothetical protein U9R75_03050, partial [Candidatus Thermoplasmatota archaeon]|nr:hypothetical protein [Candidatus Thermoplasmatota archaeon]
MTPVLLIGLWAAHPTMKVGIVLVDSIDSEYGDIVAEGFDHYDCYFDAEVLPIRFSTIDVTFLDGFYLISDFFRYGEPKELQKEYNVDIILYITGHQINNWDEGGGGFWGEADPETRSSVMTVIVFNSMSERDNRILHHIALHETFHLLGYTHNQQDRTGIMQYDTNIEVLDLVPFYQVQLPSRTVGFFLFPYAEFGFARLL